jgi:hypothetical protein
MSQFASNNYEYNIMTESEVSSILDHFDDNLLMDVVYRYLETKMNNYISRPNIINSLENNFKHLLVTFPEKKEEIEQTRINTYEKIIDTLCSECNVSFNYRDDMDYFTCAQYMWDFLACNFKDYLVLFFTKFISQEKDSIYNALKLDKYKKSKDSSTIYGKNNYEDQQIAIIAANIAEVLNYIKGFDISLENILHFCYDRARANFISSIIIDNDGQFYTKVYYTALEANFGEVITDLRLSIQREYANNLSTSFYTNTTPTEG